MNRSACTDAATAEQLLDAATRPRPAYLPAELRHLRACPDCRVAVARISRLATAHRRLAPSDAELFAARARFAARTRKRVRTSMVPRVVAAGLILAVVATAAAQVNSLRQRRRSAAAAAPRLASAVAARKPVAPQPIIVPVTGAAPVTPSRPPAQVPNRTVSPRLTKRPPAADRPASEAAEKPTPVTWTAAAEAMRAGDAARAERAFDLLAASADARTRDAARLARAQLWLSQGRAAVAHDELEDLAALGATALIRKRAADELAVKR